MGRKSNQAADGRVEDRETAPAVRRTRYLIFGVPAEFTTLRGARVLQADQRDFLSQIEAETLEQFLEDELLMMGYWRLVRANPDPTLSIWQWVSMSDWTRQNIRACLPTVQVNSDGCQGSVSPEDGIPVGDTGQPVYSAYRHELLHALLQCRTGNQDLRHIRPEWTIPGVQRDTCNDAPLNP